MSPHQKPKEEVCPEMAGLGLRTTLQAHSTQLHIGLEVWITWGTGAQTPKGQVHIRGASTRLVSLFSEMGQSNVTLLRRPS